ncbi:acyl-CoA thioester hydrolase [Brevibacterium sediminis]|uniref:Acyl-CoA thioester hydrolase n=1 Tax=Brevibacterium sediminis TaxID=1857024 RepID=A0ABQ1LLN2_9MICO|nr:alpha/beta fold hydrolase [Brevibacterium sediminis]GGC25151.1 acyl-CoA thioester hydrolase [Brevibacterium sediminis]
MNAANTQLIFLHGAGERADVWDDVIAELPADWSCNAIDLGELGVIDDGMFDLSDAADRVLQRIEAEQSTVVCGLSLGAMVATAVAARADPGALDALILSGGQVRPPKWMMRLQWQISIRLPERAFAAYGSTKSETLAMYAAVEAADLRDRLGEVRVPTAVWCGTRDIANRPAARELAEGIDGAELRFVPGMGHDWHRSHPAAFAAHLREFLSATSARTPRGR